jgi:hypothetical protein
LGGWRKKMAELCSKCGKREGYANVDRKWVCRECEVESKISDYIGALNKLPDIEHVAAVLRLSPEEIREAVNRSPWLKSIVAEKRSKIEHKNTAWWFLVPILFGIPGGLVAYAFVHDDDKEMAKSLVVLSIVSTVLWVGIALLRLR